MYPQRHDPPSADPFGDREPVPPVPAVHFGPKAAWPQDGRQVRHSPGVLWRERGEFGNPIADNNSALRDEHFFAVNDYDHIYLGGVSLRQLEEDYKVDKADLAIYLPSETSNLEKNHVQVRYLGYYEKWHPQGATITV